MLSMTRDPLTTQQYNVGDRREHFTRYVLYKQTILQRPSQCPDIQYETDDSSHLFFNSFNTFFTTGVDV